MQTAGIKGGRVYLPYAFTEHGIYMLMSVLKGDLSASRRRQYGILKKSFIMNDQSGMNDSSENRRRK